MHHRVVRLAAPVGPEGLSFQDEPVPEPGPGEVAHTMRTLGLNRADAMFARGTYLVEPGPDAPVGLEGVGIVRALGDGVEGLEIGQRVVALTPLAVGARGLAAEVAVVEASQVLPEIPGLDDESLAAFWIAYGTAYAGLLRHAQLRAGETVLVTAASSSVGLAAIQVARHVGARVVVTTRSGAKRDALLAAGADRVIATDHEPIEGVDETFDVVFDAVAGSFVERVVTRMAPRGRLVLYGILSGEPTPLPLFPTIVGALRITGMHFGYHVLAEPRAREAVVRALRQQAADGVYTPTVDATWPFDDIDKAYAYLERSNQVGKVVVQISP